MRRLAIGVAIFATLALCADQAAELEVARAEILRLQSLVRSLGGDPSEAASISAKPDRSLTWSSSMHMLYPSAVTVPKKKVYGRIIHISKDSVQAKANGNRTETEPLHNALGLDNEVRIGLVAGYGLTDRFEIFGQRSVGRDITTGTRTEDFGGFLVDVPDVSSYDTYDILGKYQLRQEHEHGFNLSLLAGTSIMLEDDESTSLSLDLGMIAERSFWGQRVYLGSGLLFASRSDFQSTVSPHANTALPKRHPNEPDSVGSRSDGEDHTVAIPLTLRLAITPQFQLFAEAVAPVDGYDTGEGPSLAVGARLLKLHYGHFVAEYNLFATNTSNTAFNATMTGGYKQDVLDIFGFNISVRY